MGVDGEVLATWIVAEGCALAEGLPSLLHPVRGDGSAMKESR